MLDADAVINNSSQKVGGSNAYPDPAPKKWVGSDPEKHILVVSRPLSAGARAADKGVAKGWGILGPNNPILLKKL